MIESRPFMARTQASGQLYDAAAKCGPYDPVTVPFEPLLQVDQIQGNILGGFNKDNQALIYIRLGEIDQFRAWLTTMLHRIATANEVVQFNRLFKSMSQRSPQGQETGAIRATWINIAFSYAGLRKLTQKTPGELKEGNDFPDGAFKQGMVSRAHEVLGDPPNSPSGWQVGGPGDEIDVILIVASDSLDSLRNEVANLDNSLSEIAQIIGVDIGRNSPDHRDLFGFRETISQPGVRGLCSTRPDDFLTPRLNVHDPCDGLPGQKLVWPGEFVLGYRSEKQGQGQEPETTFDLPRVAPGTAPTWAANGSFLVFRRLRQDVSAFNRFVERAADQLRLDPGVIRARIVGRWPDGAPVVQYPENEPGGGTTPDDCTDNVFGFPRQGTAPTTCPVAAHIRKAYPRNDRPQEVRQHRVLRRGVAYAGRVRRHPEDYSKPLVDDAEQGLLFLSYQASIEQQFEWIVKEQANNPDFSHEGSGVDLLIGQNSNGHQTRSLSVDEGRLGIESAEPFVVATGGGYFFAPSIWALERLAKPKPDRRWEPPQPTPEMLYDWVKLVYYLLGRFVYEQAPYAVGPNLRLTADFYHTGKGKLGIETAGLTRKFGLNPIDGKPNQFFNRSASQLSDAEQFECMWWHFGKELERVTKAIRIPYSYVRPDGTNVEATLLIGFAGPGDERTI